MNQFNLATIARSAFDLENRKVSIILLSAPILLTTFKYAGSLEFYHTSLEPHLVFFHSPDFTAALYMFVCSLFLMGIVPALVVKFALHEPLSSFGLARGDIPFSLKAAVILGPIMVLLTIPSSSMESFVNEYPYYKEASQSTGTFLGYSLTYLMFYAGWEFFFRGYLQFGLRDRFGGWNAILVQTLASTLLHIGKPGAEIYGAIVGGIVWGVVAFRARSFLVILVLHWMMGVSLDFFITHF